VCTDWLITSDEGKTPGTFAGKPWGVEKLTCNAKLQISFFVNFNDRLETFGSGPLSQKRERNGAIALAIRYPYKPQNSEKT
ncbi:hypothetical protein SB659_20265, partial [Arthrobacter sp. SIMBA_036]|uniref:hypothetical protein n=1 Tax=Arthrobacter sp. SIMBA_036 TaxID=3085778 RepID=UPI0039799873